MQRISETTRDPALGAAVKAVALSAVGLTVVALLGFGRSSAAGVALGGGIATANLYVFVRVSEAFMDRRGRTAPWVVIGILKMVALLFVVWMVIKNGTVPPFALAVGYGALPLGITLGSLFGPRPPETPAPPPAPDPDDGTPDDD